MKKSKMKMRKRKLFFSASVIILVISLMVWGITSFTRPIILSYLVDIKNVKDSAVKQTVPVTGLVIKDEKVVKIPLSGQVTMLVDNGERVATGTKVAKVTRISLISPEGSQEKTIYAPRAGMVSTSIDGLEGVLKPETVDVLELSQIDTIRAKLTTTKHQNTVEKGQPIIKLVENLHPLYIYLEIGKEGIAAKKQLHQNDKIKVKYNDTWFSGTVVKTETIADGQAMLIKVKEYPDELIQLRNVRLEVLQKEISGFIIPKDSLVYRRGKPGLYKIYKKKATWVPVDLQGVLKKKAAISSENLSDGTRYITNPQLVKDGDIITTKESE